MEKKSLWVQDVFMVSKSHLRSPFINLPRTHGPPWNLSFALPEDSSQQLPLKSTNPQFCSPFGLSNPSGAGLIFLNLLKGYDVV